ncbi:MAG: Wzt carbohydrate-binding domain-containing protein [Pigmentiphaga sp.]|nr:Wzt carbohydrate-binding domain-containing protein [Pigmentiphaga sp.]
MLGASDTNAVDQPMFRVGEPARLRVEIEVHEPLPGLTLGMTIRDRTGYDVFGMNTRRMGFADIGLEPGRRVVEFILPSLAIGPGHYHISMALHDDDHHVAGNYDRWDQALVFEVTFGSGVAFAGVAALPVEMEVRPIDSV